MEASIQDSDASCLAFQYSHYSLYKCFFVMKSIKEWLKKLTSQIFQWSNLQVLVWMLTIIWLSYKIVTELFL